VPYVVEFREVVWDDLETLPRNIRERILRAVELRLTTAPTHYGVKLRQALSNLWKLRVGDYRVVYEITGNHVTVWAVRHRKDVYAVVERRWFRTAA